MSLKSCAWIVVAMTAALRHIASVALESSCEGSRASNSVSENVLNQNVLHTRYQSSTNLEG